MTAHVDNTVNPMGLADKVGVMNTVAATAVRRKNGGAAAERDAEGGAWSEDGRDGDAAGGV